MEKIEQTSLTSAQESAQAEEQVNKSEKKTFWKKCGDFFDKNSAMFFAPVIVALLYICALWRYGVYPFGDKYTVASYDLSAQICPFIEHFYDVLSGKSTLTYTYGIMGGADVTGTLLYFFVSPFSFLFFIFGEGRVAHASSIVILCKLAAISVAGAWFAKKMFKGIPDYICIAIGVAYAYCGYTFMANTYVNWLDFLIYIPFCVAGFRRFVKTGKFLPFSILMACCIYTCFSIACFSMLIVYPTLIAYALICVEKEEKKHFITYLSLSFVVALLIALPILLPAFMATMTSARSGGLLDNLWYGYSNGVLTEQGFSSAITNLSNAMYAKWTYVFTDAIFVILTLFWFYRNGLKNKFSKFMLIAGILTCLPLLVDESMKLLNMGSYYSYAFRFGFLNVIYFLGGACLCIEGLCFKYAHTYDGVHLYKPFSVEVKEEGNTQNEGGMSATKPVLSKTKKPVSYCVWSILLIVVGVLAAAILINLFALTDAFARGSSKEDTALIAKITAKFPAAWKGVIEDACNLLKNMDGSFTHSLGNMEIVFTLFLIVFVVAVMGGLLVSYKKVSVKLLSYVMIFVVGMQILFYNGQLVIGNLSTQYKTLDSYTGMVERLNQLDDSYYRIKDFGDRVQDGEDASGNAKYKTNETLMGNAPLVAGSNSFSVFSSVIDKYNFVTYPLFWYNGNSTNSLKSLGRGKSFADAFLGYKYYWVPDQADDKKAAEDLGYLEPVYTGEKDKDGKDIQLKEGNFVLYENTIVLPNAYVLPRGDFRFPALNELLKPTNDFAEENRKNRVANQKALYEFLGGEAYSADDFPSWRNTETISKKLHAQGVQVEVGAAKITVKANAEKEGEALFMNFVASRGYTVTVNGKKAELIDNDLHFLSVALEEGENEVVFTYTSPYPKYMAVGVVVAALGLSIVALILKKTKWAEKCSSVVACTGVVIAGAVVAFFMIYPTGICLAKLIDFFKILI